jgi:drug/metabolite transporter (DMT)-like permease
MSTLTHNTIQPPSRALQGILCIELGMLFFVVQDGLMKSLLSVYPVWMLILVRASVSVLVLTPLILVLGRPHRILTPLWPLHLARAGLFATGFTLFYTAFPFMGLAEVSTIFFSAPLMTALLAAFWLGETIGPHRIGALLLGFAGVVISMNPTSDAFHWVAILPLITALTYAIAQIIARKIGERESTLTVGLHTLGFSGIFIVPMGWTFNQIFTPGPEFHHLRWAFPSETFTDLPQLVLLGLAGMGGYMFLSRAYQVANASLVAPFDYSYLPFAGIMAYVLWHEVPAPTTLIGMGMIIVSGVYLGLREIRAARLDADALAVTAEVSFAPGNPLQPMPLDE